MNSYENFLLLSEHCYCPKCSEEIAFGKPWDEEETWEELRPENAAVKPGSLLRPEQCVPKTSRSKSKYEPDGIS